MPTVARARLVVPNGWERDIVALLQASLSAEERDLLQRRFEVTHGIEVPWTDAVADALDGLRDQITIEWVRPNKVWTRRPNVARNRNAADTSNVDALLPGGATGFDLTGAGVILGEWDEGAPRVSHRELTGRVRVGDGAGPVDHSTEVAGTMIATGVDTPARGMATEANLIAHDWDLDTLELYTAGPSLAASNHSYGAILGWDSNGTCGDLPSWLGGTTFEDPAFGKYMADASALDAVVYARDLLVVWAAGNERQDFGGSGMPHYHWPSCSRTFTDAHASEGGVGYDTLGGQPTFKNGLVVGAVRDATADPLPTTSILSESYSSFGPMDDGRIKPDLVASGDDVYTCGADADDAYATSSGTSLASPVVTGALALLTEKYRQANAAREPRAAEMKALLLHTAAESGADPGPDYQRGYGLLDARAAAELLDADGDRSNASRQVRAGHVVEGEDALFNTSDVVPAGTALRVTVVWHDPAGAPNVLGVDDRSPALVNDLDVVLVAPDQQTTFRPWRLNPMVPAAAATRTDANRVDNVERIDVDAVDNVWSGRWSVRVTVNGMLEPRGRAQVFGLVSSVPLSAPSVPVLGLPRTLVIEVPLGSTPDDITVPIVNLGAGVLTWSLNENVPWLAPSATMGVAPNGFELALDVSDLSTPDEYVGLIEIDSSDPSGPRTLAVVLRLTCAAQCATRQCGVDPVCGASCGRCANGRACAADGRCVILAGSCPAADLGSQLGVVAQGSTAGRSATTGGSCGGVSAPDVTYEWTAPTAGRYEFTTLGSDFDTLLYLRDGACNGAELACNDDSGGVSSTVSAQLTAGQTVFVVVDGYDGTGGYVLTISRASCPSADLGSLVGGVVLDASLLGAVNSLAGTCGGGEGEDIAVRWTAPSDGEFRFSTVSDEDEFDSVLYLRDGDCEGSELECNDTPNPANGSHASDSVTANLARGQSIVVVIDGRSASDVGQLQLNIVATANSCDGVCGGRPNAACACDSACLVLGDCCADACSACGQCTCVADCNGALCGDDGCGGSCGTCGAGDVCESGACVVDLCAGVSCDACEACVAGACQALPELAACNDGLRCTVADQCVAGTCEGMSLGCNDGDLCTTDSCDESSGLCMFAGMAECCSDPVDCSDGDVCTTDTCDLATNRCQNTPRDVCCRDSADCNDENACTDDTCLLGTCFHSTAEACVGDAGHDDAAVDDAGWSNARVAGGGCDCRVVGGALGPSQHAGPQRPAGVVFFAVLLLGALGLRRRQLRARPATDAAASRSRRLR